MQNYFRIGKLREDGMCEVLVQLRGRSVKASGKTGIRVRPEYFAEGFIIETRVKSVLDRQHQEQRSRLLELDAAILQAAKREAPYSINSKWLQGVIVSFNEERQVEYTKKSDDIYDLFQKYIDSHAFSRDHTAAIKVMVRSVGRYEFFKNAMGEPFTFDIDVIDRNILADFRLYLSEEKQLSIKYPSVFMLMSEGNASNRLFYPKSNVIHEKGGNAVLKLLKLLRSFFHWAYNMGYTTNTPFIGYEVGTEKVSPVNYITIEERNRIADYDFSFSPSLEVQRDIFIFQCYVGCRVGDLIHLTPKNVGGDILTYVPHKTKDNGGIAQEARVPLASRAIELLRKYEGRDKEGRLFPFITPQKYNAALKLIFEAAGVTRMVSVRNALTGEIERVPINTIASSHMARKTFIGNAYLKVQDPNIIAKMSGHVEGSKAFNRYRRIEDETLRSVIDLIE